MGDKNYQVVSVGYKGESCGYYQAWVVVKVNGCERLGFGESQTDIYSAVINSIDQVLGPELTKEWVFGGFNFQSIPPRNRANGQGIIKCRVDIHYPQGNGFSGVCQTDDMNLALAKAYLQAINRLLLDREGRQIEEVVLV